MRKTTKVGHVTFDHSDEYAGEVTITKGTASVTVDMAALRRIVAESLRAELSRQVADAKPDALLKRSLG